MSLTPKEYGSILCNLLPFKKRGVNPFFFLMLVSPTGEMHRFLKAYEGKATPKTHKTLTVSRTCKKLIVSLCYHAKVRILSDSEILWADIQKFLR